MDFEDKTAESFLGGCHTPFEGLDGTRRRSYADKAVQQLLDAEGIQRRAEEYGREFAGKVFLDIEFGVYALYKVDILT